MIDLEGFDPYEGVIVAKPIKPRPDGAPRGMRNEWEAVLVPLTFARARIHTRLLDRQWSYEDGW